MVKQIDTLDNNYENKISRRGVTKAAAGLLATAALTGCGSKAKSVENMPVNPVSAETVQDDEVAAAEMRLETGEDVSIVEPGAAPEIIEMDFTFPEEIYEGRRDPRKTSEAAEMPVLLESDFRIYTQEIASPENLPPVWAERFEGWLNAGCTPEEAEPYLALDGDQFEQANAERAYLKEMHDKYDESIYVALTGDKELKHVMYGIFCGARQGVLRRYLYNARKNGNFVETAKVNVLHHEMRGSIKDSGRYTMATEIQITNDVGDDRIQDIYDIRGVISLSGKAGLSMIETSIATAGSHTDGSDITKPFKDLAQLA